MITVRAISAADTYALRQRVLRPNQPIACSHYPGDLEKNSLHAGAWFGESLIGVISIRPHPCPGQDWDAPWRIRGMAVVPEAQGQNCGSQLLKFAIQHATDKGAKLIWCNAREPATGFYQRFGFSILGDLFEIEDIGPHYLMLYRP